MQVLKQGSQGRDVVRLKKRLFAHKRWSRALGFTGGFGPITKKQVQKFQADVGLVVDGEVGPATWTALNSAPVNGKGERARAVAWAKSQIGVTEKPAGSNWGRPVQNWIIEGGLDFPAPWCQFFCDQLAKQGTKGRLNPAWFGGYTVAVVNQARRGEHGLKPTTLDRVQAGDWVYFDWGNGIAHVGMFLCHNANGTIQTIEGNTSFDSSGDQSNGGAVAHKVRSRSSVAACVSVPYKN